MGTDTDFILMGCDGIWETWDNDQMVEWVYNKLEQASDRSVDSLKQIVSDLMNELISPNHQQTGKCKSFSATTLLTFFCVWNRRCWLRQHDSHSHLLQVMIIGPTPQLLRSHSIRDGSQMEAVNRSAGTPGHNLLLHIGQRARRSQGAEAARTSTRTTQTFLNIAPTA